MITHCLSRSPREDASPRPDARGARSLTDFLNYLLLGITRGSMYALVALGYTLVYGVLQLINFAHSEVFMSGAFGSYLVVNSVVEDGAHPPWYGVLAVIILGLASGGLVGAGVAWCLERVAYRPLRRRGAPKLAFLISAIGASFFLSQLAGKLFGRLTSNAFPAFFDQNHVLFTIFGAEVRVLEVVIVASAIVM